MLSFVWPLVPILVVILLVVLACNDEIERQLGG